MATDMDIEMDLGIDLVEEEQMLDLPVPLNDTIKKPKYSSGSPMALPPEADATQPSPNKVHLRGLDNLTEFDIKTFASEYFDLKQLENVEWIDDNSANLVYETPAVALEALMAFTNITQHDLSQISHLQMVPAKSFPGNCEARLEARLAVAGDRKEAGARDRSRFYLFNPEHDPAERRRRDGHGRRGGRRYRDREDGRYSGLEREDVDAFDASLYDDDEVTRAVRASKSRSSRESRSSISSVEYRGQGIRKDRSAGGAVKELFPDRLASLHRDGGRLRNRSASPLRDMESDQRRRNISASGSANRLQAQMIKARLKDAALKPRELFPQKASINHRRSDAFDATDATADLFASRMSVPFLDTNRGSSPTGQDFTSRVTKVMLEDRISSADNADRDGFGIRGITKQQSSIGISIKGIALTPGGPLKELFPHKIGPNAGKELFSDKLEGRGGTRRKAQDMFR